MNNPESSQTTGPLSGESRPKARGILARLFGWRTWRACLFVLVCLATLIGLFYAEENWRGERAWSRYKRELETQGEKFDWQASVPPSVPDDQNFAMTPLLMPLLDYELQTDADGLPKAQWRDTNGRSRVMNLRVWRTGVATNPPDGGDWQKGKPINLAAWQGYFRWTPPPSEAARPASAGSTTNDGFPVAENPQTPAEDVLLALSRVDQELKELQAASARPYARFPVHYGEGLGTLLPHLSVMKSVSRIVTLRALAELDLGRTEPAFNDVRFSFYTADALKAEPFIITHLVRIAIIDQSLQAVWEGLAARRWSSNQLAAFEDYLGTVDILPDYARSVRGESNLGAYTGELTDRKRRTAMLQFLFPGEAIHNRFVQSLNFYPRGWFRLNDLTAARLGHEQVLPLINVAERRAYPSRTREVIKAFEEAPSRPGNAIVKAFGAFVAPQRFARAQAHLDLARVACALERYRQVRQEYPESLATLVPAFVKSLPGDMVSGRPLIYRRAPDGSFVLYGLGWDEKDDDGAYPVIAERSLGATTLRSWMADGDETGDWVWRYR